MPKLLVPALAFFICLFIFPSDCAAGAKDGLLLWFNTMIPAVFPFILLTNILRRLDGIRLISRLFGKFIQKLFCCSAGGAYAVITGFLCGYPMGAKAVCDSLSDGVISRSEADYLLTFCNNPSPMFIINFVLTACLQNAAAALPFFLMIYGSTWLNARLWYTAKYRRHIKGSTALGHCEKSVFAAGSPLKDSGILMTSIELMQKIGVYMIVFSIVCRLIFMLPFFSTPALFLKTVIAGFTEQTTGLASLSALPVPADIKIVPAAVFTCFGGFAAAAQTYGIIRPQGLCIRDYLYGKLSHGLLAGLMCALLLFFN